jgi:hypothetical protein
MKGHIMKKVVVGLVLALQCEALSEAEQKKRCNGNAFL